jgi:formamidopyrimidine-DNA glycosylase
VHFRFALDDGSELRMRDPRKFGRMGLYKRDEAGTVLGAGEASELFAAFGPEPLDDGFTLNDFRKRIRRRKGRLKSLLMDQGFVAGVGNIYADEALWRAKVHGERRCSTLTKPALGRVLDHAREVMAEALGQGGTSFDSLYVNVNGASGYFDRSLHAYGRAGTPCDRCGATIRREQFMNRSSFSCPVCQPRPRRRS